jgi:hypothetical protein
MNTRPRTKGRGVIWCCVRGPHLGRQLIPEPYRGSCGRALTRDAVHFGLPEGTAERGGRGAVARVERPAEMGGAAKAPAGGDLGDGAVAEPMVGEVGSAPA